MTNSRPMTEEEMARTGHVCYPGCAHRPTEKVEAPQDQSVIGSRGRRLMAKRHQLPTELTIEWVRQQLHTETPWSVMMTLVQAHGEILRKKNEELTKLQEAVRAYRDTAEDLLAEAYAQSVDPRCADHMCNRDDLEEVLPEQ